MSTDLASDTPFDFEIYTDCSGQGIPQEEHIVGNNSGSNQKAKGNFLSVSLKGYANLKNEFSEPF